MTGISVGGHFARIARLRFCLFAKLLAIQYAERFSHQAQSKLMRQVVNVVYQKQCPAIGNIYKLALLKHVTGMSFDPSRDIPSLSRPSPSMKYG
jgi:hypothetical protein